MYRKDDDICKYIKKIKSFIYFNIFNYLIVILKLYVLVCIFEVMVFFEFIFL